MKLGCFLSLALYAALVFGYYVWLGQTFESKELWIGSFIAGLIALGGIGALCNSYLAWRDGAVLSDAIIDLPRRDGKRTAAAGTLEPLGQPLTAPLSGKSCVLYEYDIYRNVTRTKKGGGTETSKTIDFAGLGKAECFIRSTSSKLRLIGFPDLDPIGEEELVEPADMERAKQYVQFTAWEDTSGLGIFHGARDMFSALTGNEESLRKDWRMVSVRDCAWLRVDPNHLAMAAEFQIPSADNSSIPAAADQVQDEWDDEEEFGEDDDADEDSPRDQAERAWHAMKAYQPELAEKRIAPGQQVVVIGRYDEVQQGLVSGGTQLIKIYLDDVQSVARKLASAKWGYLFGGIITLIIVNLAAWGAQWVYRHSDDTQRKWHDQLEQAVRDGDVQAIDRLVKRGADLNALRQSGDRPLLMDAEDPTLAMRLIELGVDVNATDADGRTALMVAAHAGRSQIVRVLINAGADLDRKSDDFHLTALMMAIDAEQAECVEILRQAGAKDETVTEKNGQPIDESHEAFGVCREYLAAVFAADPQKLRELSTPELGMHFDDVDFGTWQESRPTKPRLVSGFVREDDATLTIVGPAPHGADRTWNYQLRRIDGKWLVARERWLIRGG